MPTAEELRLVNNLRDLGYTGNTLNYPIVFQFLFGFDKVSQAKRIRTEIGEEHRPPVDAGEHWRYHHDAAIAKGNMVDYLLNKTDMFLGREGEAG